MKGLQARELRDAVYVQLLHDDWLSEDVHIGFRCDYTTDEYGHLKGDPHPPDSLGYSWPCYLAREYINDDFINELSETFYSKARFVVLHEKYINTLLTSGPLRLVTEHGYVRLPLNCIRHIKINLDIDRGFRQRHHKGERQYYQEEVENMQNKIRIEPISALKLTLAVAPGSKLGMEKYEESLALMVYDLRARGAEVAIQSWSPPDEGWPEFKYDEPISFWHDRIRSNSAFVSLIVQAISET